jgi:hypothetical protein
MYNTADGALPLLRIKAVQTEESKQEEIEVQMCERDKKAMA